jgi:endonuclease/exonuclease/phosphatase family metal-dependent hydrolase
MPELVVATFNVHGGIDGWGRSTDVVSPARRLDADVLVLQEAFTAADGSGTVGDIADATGLAVVAHLQLARVELYPPHPDADRRWRPTHGMGPTSALQVRRLDGPDVLERAHPRVARHHPGPARSGRWGLAVLTRLPLTHTSVIDMGRLRGDRADRQASVVEVDVDGAPLTVVGAHMSHLSTGSPLHFLALRRALALVRGPAVVAGDMNLWGPPTTAVLGPWRRAVAGRTWPAWRPIAQPDHILVNRPVRVVSGEVLRGDTGSDHLPLRARLAF